MQYNKTTYLAVFILGFAISIMAQTNTAAYDYPVKPGTPEWMALTSHSQMQEVCQIPADVLENMPTKALVQTCLDYPLYGDMLAYDYTQEGFDQITAGFNGLQELLSRKDAGAHIVQKYRDKNPGYLDNNWSMIQTGQYAFQIFHIEMLLAQDAILAGLSRDDRKQLMRIAQQKFQAKSENAEVYSILHYNSIALMLGRTLMMDNYQPLAQTLSESPRMNAFFEKAFLADFDLINEILRHADQYLTQN